MEPDDASGDRTLTFLFTDIEDSTGHWQRSPQAMRRAIEQHDLLLKERFEAYGGHVFKTVGDAFCVAFPNASVALAAAIAAQRHLLGTFAGEDAPLPLRVRMALHTGDVQTVDDDYRGVTLSCVSRALGLAHGGQILLTAETQLLSRTTLPEGARIRDLGEYKLRGFDRPCRLHQLLHSDLPDDFPPLKSSVNVPHNLPRSLTPFIGRERDIAEVRRRLGEYPLVTLTGTGGSGKTRLAVEVGETLLADFPDGVFFVDLAPRTESHLVWEAVRAALRARPDAVNMPDSIVEQIQGKRILLILDNCEHIVDACAVLAEELLQQVESLRILATSRESLGIGGESVWPVPGLPLPDSRRPVTPRRLLQSEAAQFFKERAVAAAPSFVVTRDNAAYIADICKRLDGLPLALTIAAAWAGTLPPRDIEQRLSKLLKTGGPRPLSARQRTIAATIDWSYNLLSESERVLLRRLSIFVGGWTLEAAEEVCAGQPVDDVMTGLFGLCRKSLIMADDRNGAARYWILETIREYAAEALSESGESNTMIARHRDYFLSLAREAEPELKGPEQRIYLDRLDADRENLRNAMIRDGDSRKRLALGVTLHRYWMIRGEAAEGFRLLQELLAAVATDNTATRDDLMPARNALGILAWITGNLEAARQAFEEALSMTADDDTVLRPSLSANLAIIYTQNRDLESAYRLIQDSVAIYRRTAGEPRPLAMALSNMGAICIERQDLDGAYAALLESLSLQREWADAFALGNTLQNLGEVCSRSYRHLEALPYFQEALQHRAAIKEPRGIYQTLLALAKWYLQDDQFEFAASLLAASQSFRNQAAADFPEDEIQEERQLEERLASKGISVDRSSIEGTDFTSLSRRLPPPLMPAPESRDNVAISI